MANSELSPDLQSYLRLCGLSKRKIRQYNADTRMWHDLGIYGDIAETFMEALVSHYSVDMAGFEFERYFPPEFVGENIITRNLIAGIPFVGHFVRRRGNYLPLTLGMIETVLRTKKWHPMAE